jgi:hypothetical protein
VRPAHAFNLLKRSWRKCLEISDETSRIIYSILSFVPIDSCHDRSGYVGLEKDVQLVPLDRDGSRYRLMHTLSYTYLY